MSDDADLVGFLVGRDEGSPLYGCAKHSDGISDNATLEILRDEAREIGALCETCGLELWEAEGIG